MTFFCCSKVKDLCAETISVTMNNFLFNCKRRKKNGMKSIFGQNKVLARQVIVRYSDLTIPHNNWSPPTIHAACPIHPYTKWGEGALWSVLALISWLGQPYVYLCYIQQSLRKYKNVQYINFDLKCLHLIGGLLIKITWLQVWFIK